MKNFIYSFLITSSIFISHYIFISHSIFIPFLWSVYIIYLAGKNHLYIGINSYILLLLILFADKLNFDLTSKIEYMYSNVAMFVSLILILLYQELYIKKFKITTTLSIGITMVFYLIPLFYIIYSINFDTFITEDVFFAISQTNFQESIEFIRTNISPLWIFVLIVCTAIVGWLLLKQEKKETLIIEKSLLIFLIIVIGSTISVNNKNIRLYAFAKNATKNYLNELNFFKEIQAKRESGEITFDAKKLDKGETYFVIIGESLNKNHMGIYDYLRNTTPLLSDRNNRNELLLFNNVYSNHTHTMHVLSMTLTEANQLNKKHYYDSFSIINILNKSDFETYWITNQSLYGALGDNPVSLIANDADHIISINRTISKSTKTQKYDGELIEEVEKMLNVPTKKNRVFFIHLMGSHVDYSNRYPKEYNVFNGQLDQGDFGTKISENDKLANSINCYDNSVYYNDYIINSLIALLEKEKGSRALLYVADHGEDVIDQLSHNSGKFTYDMTQIPMIMWLSEDYKEKYNQQYLNLKNHTTTLFGNDLLYDTLIGLFNIQTNKYDSMYDLTSKAYSLPTKSAYVLHTQQLYASSTNYLWWQKENAKYLIDNNQSSRIFPHRIDSIGKLKDIWRDGFRSFEIDVRFGDDNTHSFRVGHNDPYMGHTLDDLLSSINYNKIQKIWLDFKNLDKNNYQDALLALTKLDKKFSIKQKIIIESGTTESYFKDFSNSGWHISYYLPTKNIKKMLKKNEDTEMKELALQISKQCKEQNLSAVSFDNQLYPFVKKYLEKLLPSDVVYHTWYGPNLYDKNFKRLLFKSNLYRDQRIKTILVPYQSKFNL